MSNEHPGGPVPRECPAGAGVAASVGPAAVPMYGPQFTSDAHSVYEEMCRQPGGVARVEVAAGVTGVAVTDYGVALEVLRDREGFRCDPSAWVQRWPAEHPAPPPLWWRPDVAHTDGDRWKVSRHAITVALTTVDPLTVPAIVLRQAHQLLGGVGPAGTADLVRDFAVPLVSSVLAALLGVPAPLHGRLAAAAWIATESGGPEAVEAARQQVWSVMSATAVAASAPGWETETTVAGGLTVAGLPETVASHQLTLLFLSGTVATAAVITSTLLRSLTDTVFGSALRSGAMPLRDVIDTVLLSDPTWSGLARFPTQPKLLGTMMVQPDELVLVVPAACHRGEAFTGGVEVTRAHLGFGAGPHGCPARVLGTEIAVAALEQVLDLIPEMVSAGPPVWATGLLQHALAALPVRFPQFITTVMPVQEQARAHTV
ncbi:cytochrome P450 [Nocardia sp. alder85J]|uniref:cytochrome P450 n=1 Tax=Nocardia sp. alder85J TaxID=2862949 RepID=UPI001CD2F185|nr:cytochrome P450 [Nocardia sp. alder85J]MCX4094576.1 hypothetical protein [Nocardia sp. alder85J]